MREEQFHVHVVREKDRKNLSMRYIDAEAQKSGKDQLLPLTPDFATFLLGTLPDQRRDTSSTPRAGKVDMQDGTKSAERSRRSAGRPT